MEIPQSELATSRIPILQLSGDAAKALVNNRVRIEPQYLINAQPKEWHNGIDSCDGMQIPATKFTESVDAAIQLDPHLTNTITDVFLKELGDPTSPLQPSEALREDFRTYLHLVRQTHADAGNVDRQALREIRERLGRRLSIFQTINYYQAQAERKLDHLAAFIPDDPKLLGEYIEMLAKLDNHNPYYGLPEGDQPAIQMAALTPHQMPLNSPLSQMQSQSLSDSDRDAIRTAINETADGMS